MQYVKRTITGLMIIMAGNATAASNGFFIETGLGVDYGGLGTQVHMPSPTDALDPFITTGVFYDSSRTGEQLGIGVGVNYFVSRHQAFTAYGGTLHVDRYNDGYELERDPKYGLSVGYKYYFRKKSKAGFVLGANYNIYDGGHYPFITLGYRY